MVEHQSTNNPNMALRLGMYYFNSVYNYIRDNNLNVFSDKPIQVPKPEFYVVYNGRLPMKEKSISLNNNLFDNSDNAININVESFDINYINLEEVIKNDNNNIVNFYSYFINEIRESNDINKVIESCRAKGFTFDYLDKKEWIDMALMEYTVEDRIRDEVNERVKAEINERVEEVVNERLLAREEELREKFTSILGDKNVELDNKDGQIAKLQAELQALKEKEVIEKTQSIPKLNNSKDVER